MNRNRMPLLDTSHDENSVTNAINLSNYRIPKHTKSQIIFGVLICLLSNNVTFAQTPLEVQSTSGTITKIHLNHDPGIQELSAQNEALTQELKDLKAKVEA